MRAFPFFLLFFFLITAFRNPRLQFHKTKSSGTDSCGLSAGDSDLFYRDAVYLAEEEARSNPDYRKTIFVPEKLILKYYHIMTSAWCAMEDTVQGDLQNEDPFQEHFFTRFDPYYFNGVAISCKKDSTGKYPSDPDPITNEILKQFKFEPRTLSVYQCERVSGNGVFLFHNELPVNLAGLNYQLQKNHSPDSAVRTCCFGGVDDNLWKVTKQKNGYEIRYSIHKTGPASNTSQYTLTNCTSIFLMEKDGAVLYQGYEQGKTDTLYYQFLVE